MGKEIWRATGRTSGLRAEAILVTIVHIVPSWEGPSCWVFDPQSFSPKNRQGKKHLADEKVVRSYVEDLREVLRNSPLPEQKAFICSFFKEVKVTGQEVLLTYTIPLPSEGLLRQSAAVLDTVNYGGPTRARTWNRAVMSRLLCH